MRFRFGAFGDSGCAVSALALIAALLGAGGVHAADAPYRAVPVKCGDGMTAQKKFEKAKWTFENGWSDPSDIENMYLCVAEAALDGYAPAETLYARITSHRAPNAGIRAGTLIFGDLEDSVYWFGRAAAGGDGSAAIYAGEMYQRGDGVTQSDEQAMILYRRAADLRNPLAGTHIDRLRQRPARIAAFEAKTWPKAIAGDVEAMRAIASAYSIGDPYVPDSKAALQWMLKAAEAGDADAMLAVAGRYSGGSGTNRDDNAAVDWLVKAWNAGKRSAAGPINILYYKGQLDETHKQTLEALSAARHPENANAVASVAAVVQPEAVPDRAALEVRAKTGDPDAIFDLAEALETGDGGQADPRRARDLFLGIADQMPEAAMNLGDIYYTGKAGKSDPAQAVRWYSLAAAMGDGTGAKNAALIYRDGGEGVAADGVEAYSLALLMAFDPTGFRAGLREALTPEQRVKAVVRACRISLSHFKN